MIRLLILGLVLLVQSNPSSIDEEFNQTKWLIGTWENKTSRGSIYETWREVGETELAGKSYVLKEGDTVLFETVQLIQEGEAIFYIPVVGNQNDGKPIRFKLKELSTNKMVFENLAHDFPQQISYARLGNDSLLAVISGSKNGQVRKQEFPMTRIKD